MIKNVSTQSATAVEEPVNGSYARPNDWQDEEGLEMIAGIGTVVLVVALITGAILLSVFRVPLYTPNTDPHKGWVVTESNDFGPVYQHKCNGTTLIVEHTTRGVHTPNYFENDPLCVG